ncbi:hypothetical protein HWV62_37946 [Athelia sp. TMB]|nr:hypothetical protein HWV62_37946 [Athelia sp. TMB]
MSNPRSFKSSALKKSDVPPGYVADPSAGPMLRFQASLPRLPVPTLSSTASKYLETVRPLLTDAEFNTTEKTVAEFVKSSQAAELQKRLEELQKRLEGRAGDPNVKSWLSEWWNEAAYMGYRDPVVVFVSYYYVHVADKRRRDAPKRAASLVKAMLPFREMVESGTLEPEKVRGAPLCMDSYKWMFHASRYPTKPSDTAHKFDPQTHNHVVFIRKNKFFSVPLVTPDGQELSAAELEVQVERVIRLAGEDKAVPIGALTSDNRDIWTDARETLVAASPQNEESLKAIESAAVLVALDDSEPVTREEIAWGMWVGDGRNRFYDKHQFIVCDNGVSGFLGEHSCMDGTPTLRLNEFILASLAANKIDLGPSRTEATGSSLPEPRELEFVVDSKVQQAVESSCQRFDELVGQHHLQVLHYEGYGKDYIKKFKASPDAWAQLIKQLAFHKMFNRPGVTYESAQTRKYQLGRTEVIRSASSESKAWAEAMLNPEETDEHRSTLFRRAVQRHLQYAAWAADGQGVDRHLFGLKKMLRDGESVPKIYEDKAFGQSNHWELSTSQLSSNYFDGWGYGEVVPDGYGLSYSIGNDNIRWTITSLRRDGEKLRHYLAEAATETRVMMERAAAAEKAAAEKAKL